MSTLVSLNSQPTSTVTVDISVTGDSDVTASETSLSFTADNWSTAQSVTVDAEHDSDAADDTATVAHEVSGGDYGSSAVSAESVRIDVTDDESPSTGVTLTASPQRVDESSNPIALEIVGTLNGGTLLQDTTIALSVSPLTATQTDDYTAGTATLTIAEGQPSGTAELTLTRFQTMSTRTTRPCR